MARLLVMRTVMFCGFLTMVRGVDAVGMRQMRVVGRLFVLSGVMMFCGLGVMFCRLRMVFRGIFMVLSAFMHSVDSLMSLLDKALYRHNRSAFARTRDVCRDGVSPIPNYYDQPSLVPLRIWGGAAVT